MDITMTEKQTTEGGVFERTFVVAAPVERAWHAFIDREGREAWLSPPGHDPIENPEAWMTTVALNLARSRRRRMLAERRARDRMTPGDPPTSPGPEAVDLRRALAALPRREREAVVLHYYLDLPVSAVATVQRISEGTVKTSLHRARRSLADALAEPEWAEEEVERERR